VQRNGIVERVGSSALIVLLTVCLAVPTISSNASWSPIDEQTHIDYAWKISHGQIPHAGDAVSDEILADWSCSGQENAELPACGTSDATPSDYPNRGENYNYFQTPVYYFVAGMIARATVFFVGAQKFDTVLRYISSVLTALGLVLLYLVLRKWGVSQNSSLFGSILVLTFPNVLGSATRATPDSAAILAAVAAMFVAYRIVDQKRLGLVLPVGLTVVLTGVKTLSALPMLCLALYLLLSGLFGRLAVVRGRVVAVAFSIPLSFLVIYIGWSQYQSRYVPADWVTPVQGINTIPVEGSPLGEWLNSPVNGADLAAGGSFPSTVSPALLAWLALGLACVSVVVSLGSWAVLDRNDPWRSVAFTLLIGVLVWPVLVQLQAYMGDVASYFPHPTPRYGLSLIGLIGAAFAMTADRRRAVPALIGVASLSFTLALGAVTGVLNVGS